MKVSEKIKSEVLQVYDTWLQGYLNGDVPTYDAYFDDTFHFIGSTNNEEFLNRTETTQFFANTADQLAGKCDLRNETRILEKFGEHICITHVFDAWFLNKSDYTYYGRFRFSNILKKNKEGWRFIYQHFSTPDAKTDKGETIGFDKVSEENQKLREAIKRRTIELEAKNRALEIEGALERVRSQVTSMQESSDLFDIVVAMRNEFISLGHDADYFWHMRWLEDRYNMSMTSEDGSRIGMVISIPKFVHDDIESLAKWEAGTEPAFILALDAEEAWDYIENMNTHGHYQLADPNAPTEEDIAHIGGLTFIIARTSHGEIGFSLAGKVDDPPKESIDTLISFAKVFDLAYTRFLDLQKAEAQAREAKIEASLEKVRSVALSLQKPDDMLDIAKILYEQLLELGFSDIRNAIIDIHNDDDETFLDYDYSHDMSSAITELSYYGDPVIEKQVRIVQSSNDAFFEIELHGAELQELIETRLKNGERDDPRLHSTDHLTYNLYSFGNGAIGISNFGVLTDDQKKILKRFRNVFTFAYKRYIDLTKAAAQAREAKIEAALEKVRSVALSMNESKDLLTITKELYEQLLELGFDDIRNALIDVNNEDAQTFLDYDYSHEMGGTITLMSYDDDPTLEEQLQVIANTTDGFSEMVLEGRQLQDLIEMRRKNGEAEDPRLLKADSVSYILYAFGNGAIGISNFGALTKDQKNILDRFRNVFTFAYQRFSDLLIKEEQSAALLTEKRQLEKTLTDLQETQRQLIQSEKMASLGELTAGIAHEIQNPLNFVNNFSEVSNELIEEVDEEIANGDFKEVKLLLTDIKQNLQKIHHHGQRADAIVKGMLQHSRSSSAEKEPTDINKLADEYFRLAYHGLRAKDKSFNATIETNFDDGIGMAMVIPQDIGRVILNLITNAFYAVNEKKSEVKESSYEPKVSVSTHQEEKHIAIKVKDNGNGIPKGILDKIFQPFFTTKPTGKGTGLGLSMSYDVVTKGHGGNLTVETKKGKGTTFTIQIPKS
ncbi:ATP-binding protein [Luteirhabdus pelagi]|uniref:ATP-binding protein n=1 Tax=Luteirhabdus pelagi TaxID=2792783 RepID=UPI001939F87F|nr:ATP-binding protein [Luteirhabdus pelagi]